MANAPSPTALPTTAVYHASPATEYFVTVTPSGSTVGAAAAAMMAIMTLIDLASLRPTVEDVQLVARALTELGEASAAELAAELPLNLATIAGVLRNLERAGRARRSAAGWVAVVPVEPQSARRRSWRQGGSVHPSQP